MSLNTCFSFFGQALSLPQSMSAPPFRLEVPSIHEGSRRYSRAGSVTQAGRLAGRGHVPEGAEQKGAFGGDEHEAGNGDRLHFI